MKFDQNIYEARPWYHDFGLLGIQTDFRTLPLFYRILSYFGFCGKKKSIKNDIRGACFMANQRNKEEYLFPYISRTLNNKGSSIPETFLELFCADGFYSFYAKRELPSITTKGIDIDGAEIERANLMARVLKYNEVEFLRKDVFEESGVFDVVLCAGGLYHVSNPETLLKKCEELAKEYLIIQTVILFDEKKYGHFISPAPGWQHGCRFTDTWIRDVLKKTNFQIIESATNELEGNLREEDRYSGYYLCKKK